MFAALSTALSGEVAKQWAVRVLSPAFTFWAGGATAVWWGVMGSPQGWPSHLIELTRFLEQLPLLGQAALVFLGLLLIVGSGLVVERLTSPVLRFLEGYWPFPAPLRDLLINHRCRKAAETDAQIQELSTLRDTPQGLTPAQKLELAAAFARTLRTPAQRELVMPTRLGDLLRAAEYLPQLKYGLDTVACWPHLWLVLPSETKQEIATARLALDAGARSVLWGILFLVWTPWAWWSALVALAVVVPSYYVSMLGAADNFGTLVKAAYDLNRMQLYDALRLQRPSRPVDEPETGRQLSISVKGGIVDPSVRYV